MKHRMFRHLYPLVLGLAFGLPLFCNARGNDSIREYTTELYDSARQRVVPLGLYVPAGEAPKQVVLFNHGYGGIDPQAYRSYTYLTRELARQGWFVISVQHERPGDAPLAMEGDLNRNRLPNWQQGVDNMLFVIAQARNLWPSLDWSNLTVIGHSNGGDMTMLLAERHPEVLRRAISLDHRRMPVPRAVQPRLASLRGCDYEADPGVLPSEEEARRCGIVLIRYDDIAHGDMDDKGSREKHDRLCRDILRLVRELK